MYSPCHYTRQLFHWTQIRLLSTSVLYREACIFACKFLFCHVSSPSNYLPLPLSLWLCPANSGGAIKVSSSRNALLQAQIWFFGVKFDCCACKYTSQLVFARTSLVFSKLRLYEPTHERVEGFRVYPTSLEKQNCIEYYIDCRIKSPLLSLYSENSRTLQRLQKMLILTKTTRKSNNCRFRWNWATSRKSQS